MSCVGVASNNHDQRPCEALRLTGYLHAKDFLRDAAPTTIVAVPNKLKTIVMNRVLPHNAHTRIDIIAYRAGQLNRRNDKGQRPTFCNTDAGHERICYEQ